MFNITLNQFSHLTARSLSTFKRDFKKSFHTTPQKWLTQKRLELAHYQLAEKNKKPIEIYDEIGFEDLSHFSYAFKRHFGYTPSELIRQQRIRAIQNKIAGGLGMEYTRLGNSGLEVSRICLGCMSYGNTGTGINDRPWTSERGEQPKFHQAGRG